MKFSNIAKILPVLALSVVGSGATVLRSLTEACVETPNGAAYYTDFGDCLSYAPGGLNDMYCAQDVDSNGIMAEDACSECGKCIDEDTYTGGPTAEPTYEPYTNDPTMKPTYESSTVGPTIDEFYTNEPTYEPTTYEPTYEPEPKTCVSTPDGSPYSTIYGDCPSYAPGAFIAPGDTLPNHDYCDLDVDSNGIKAEDACGECGTCVDAEDFEPDTDDGDTESEPTFAPNWSTTEPTAAPNVVEPAISDQCVSDTEALYLNTELATAAEDMGLACESYTAMTDDFTIIADWTDCPAAKAFQDTCTAAGGQPIVSPTINISCDIVGLVMEGIPDCLGKSCDAASVQTELIQQLEVELETQLGTECDVQQPGMRVRNLASAPAWPDDGTNIILNTIAMKEAAALLPSLKR